jgi:16S rRNA A1518/A1519 N6-dimethyltransferase RsmA/KsgA/DIM1 with predicted DNA glycosylase/AP lyase activity
VPQHPTNPRHELGHNFRIDRAVINRIVDLASQRSRPIIEWGTGNGAITYGLAGLGLDIRCPAHSVGSST